MNTSMGESSQVFATATRAVHERWFAWMHRFTRVDVESALAGYRELTHDDGATLELVDMAKTTIYRVQHSQHLHGFQAWGAYAAYNAIKRFCDGYRIGAGMPPEKELSAWRWRPKRGRGL